MSEHGWIDVFHSVDTDHGIGLAANITGDDRHIAAGCADVKVRCFAPKLYRVACVGSR